jgi:hypothetical protein
MKYQVLHNKPQSGNVSHVIHEGDDAVKAREVFEHTPGLGMFQLWQTPADAFSVGFSEEEKLVNERHGPRRVSINCDDEFTTLIFDVDGTLYLFGEGPTSDVPPGPGRISGFNNNWGSGSWFMFWIVDCAFPCCYIVQHDSENDAYEEFLDWQVDQLMIDPDDYKDYGLDGDNPTCSFTSNGVPVDTESVQMKKARLVMAYDCDSNVLKALETPLYELVADDRVANAAGSAIGHDFGLKKSREHTDRWETENGTFTNIGLTRRAIRMVSEAIHIAGEEVKTGA